MTLSQETLFCIICFVAHCLWELPGGVERQKEHHCDLFRFIAQSQSLLKLGCWGAPRPMSFRSSIFDAVLVDPSRQPATDATLRPVLPRERESVATRFLLFLVTTSAHRFHEVVALFSWVLFLVALVMATMVHSGVGPLGFFALDNVRQQVANGEFDQVLVHVCLTSGHVCLKLGGENRNKEFGAACYRLQIMCFYHCRACACAHCFCIVLSSHSEY